MKIYGYCRVSGKAQVLKSGLQRQEKSIRDYAKSNKMEVEKIYFENGVSGTIENRPALTEMLLDLESGDIKTVVIEKIDRLARDLMIQESIIRDLRHDHYKLISVHEGASLLSNDPSRKLIRQVLGAFSEYEKRMIVQKLRISRERMKKLTGKCEGRKVIWSLILSLSRWSRARDVKRVTPR